MASATSACAMAPNNPSWSVQWMKILVLPAPTLLFGLGIGLVMVTVGGTTSGALPCGPTRSGASAQRGAGAGSRLASLPLKLPFSLLLLPLRARRPPAHSAYTGPFCVGCESPAPRDSQLTPTKGQRPRSIHTTLAPLRPPRAQPPPAPPRRLGQLSLRAVPGSWVKRAAPRGGVCERERGDAPRGA
jgi:hypothetical protein